jgi:uncharacterized protein
VQPNPTTYAVQVTAAGPLESVRLTTSDGISLAALRLGRREDPQRTALIHVHGFTHHIAYSATRRVSTALAEHADVVAFDMRGHGNSGGRNTVGDREILDVDAAVAWARTAGYARIATIGLSLGAAVSLRQAALGAHRPDAVVAVSPPARWYSRETTPMRRVHWLLEQPHGRALGRLLGVRLDRPWAVVPPSPVEVVASIAPAPLLLVHFDRDPYFSAAHPQALVAASGGHAQLWTESGTGHGETGTDVALAERIAGWAVTAAGPPDDRSGDGSTVFAPPPAARRATNSEVG